MKNGKRLYLLPDGTSIEARQFYYAAKEEINENSFGKLFYELSMFPSYLGHEMPIEMTKQVQKVLHEKYFRKTPSPTIKSEIKSSSDDDQFKSPDYKRIKKIFTPSPKSPSPDICEFGKCENSKSAGRSPKFIISKDRLPKKGPKYVGRAQFRDLSYIAKAMYGSGFHIESEGDFESVNENQEKFSRKSKRDEKKKVQKKYKRILEQNSSDDDYNSESLNLCQSDENFVQTCMDGTVFLDESYKKTSKRNSMGINQNDKFESSDDDDEDINMPPINMFRMLGEERGESSRNQPSTSERSQMKRRFESEPINHHKCQEKNCDFNSGNSRGALKQHMIEKHNKGIGILCKCGCWCGSKRNMKRHLEFILKDYMKDEFNDFIEGLKRDGLLSKNYKFTHDELVLVEINGSCPFGGRINNTKADFKAAFLHNSAVIETAQEYVKNSNNKMRTVSFLSE